MADLKNLYTQLKAANDSFKIILAAAKADGDINFVEKLMIDATKNAIKTIEAKIKEEVKKQSTESKGLEADIFNGMSASEKASSPHLIQHTKVTATISFGEQKKLKPGMLVLAGGKFKGWVQQVFPTRAQVIFLVMNERQQQALSKINKVTLYPTKSYSANHFDKAVDKAWKELTAKYSSTPIAAKLIQGAGGSSSDNIYIQKATVGFSLPSGFKWVNLIKRGSLISFGKYKGKILEVYDNIFNRAKVEIYLRSELEANDAFQLNGEIKLGQTFTLAQFKKQIEQEELEENNNAMKDMRAGRDELTEEEAKKERGK